MTRACELLKINTTIVMDDKFFFLDRNSNIINFKNEGKYFLKDIIVEDTIYLRTCIPSSG
jgi:hypothetical protein